MARRTGTVVGSAAAVVLLAAGPASAHFCYLLNADQSAQQRALSNGWNTFAEDVASFFPGLCDDGVGILAEAGGVSPDTPIKAHGVAAAGTLGKGMDHPAIGHLDFAAIELAVPEALAACE